MPMDKNERAQAMRKFATGVTPGDDLLARNFAKELPKMVRQVRSQLLRMDRKFQRLSGADNAAKQTQVFDAISAGTDGSLVLHDIAQLLDCCLTVANDWRQPEDDVVTIPFTDADVDAYEAP